MNLISHDLQDGGKLPHRHVFNGMGYDGDNISPHLAWDEVPDGTKSFVVTCYDPMRPPAPAGGTGWSPIYRRKRANYRREPAPVWPRCRPAQSRPAPISASPATAARRRQKGKAIATSLRCMRWMSRRSRSMKGQAVRW